MAYIGLLFAIAWYADRRARRGRSLIANPVIYSLSLAVYAAAWTFFGSVGRAAQDGVGFPAIYIGPTLEEVEAETAKTGRKLYEGAGITAADLSFENMYDGFTLFHQFHLEGLGYRGIKCGEALDLYQTDISIAGPNPVSPSGGNIGSGRSRFWMHTDCIQQLQGRAGARPITGVTPEIAVSGGPMPLGGNFSVWSATPD